MYRITALVISTAIAVSAIAAQDHSTFTLIDHKNVTTTEKAVKTSDKKGTGVPSKDRKSLQFKGADVNLVVYTGPDNDMLSFRIQGKRNPTLVVDPGATLHILFANTDDDMFHDMRFGSVKPPFDVTPSIDGTVGTDQLAHKSDASVNAEQITVKVPSTPGTYTYFCSMKGHAKGGMYGFVVIK